MTAPKEFGIIGLGRIGSNLARQALEKGFTVIGLTRGKAPEDLIEMGLIQIAEKAEFAQHLSPPRPIFLYVPAGESIDRLFDDLSEALGTGDIFIDGGNSYWGDSIRRGRSLAEKGIGFIDLGTSGGVEGARHGACFMAGGERKSIARVEPILTELAAPGGYLHAGPIGAGHFAKLVHNGIESGMLRAIGEGVELLANYPDQFDVAEVLQVWRNGSVIRSRLIDLMEQSYRKHGDTREMPSFADDNGEVSRLIDDALRMDVPVPVIAQSVMQLVGSRDREKSFADALEMMRQGFARERREGRVEAFLAGE